MDVAAERNIRASGIKTTLHSPASVDHFAAVGSIVKKYSYAIGIGVQFNLAYRFNFLTPDGSWVGFPLLALLSVWRTILFR